MMPLSSVPFGLGLNIRNRIACLAPVMILVASFRSTRPIVGVNQSRSEVSPIFRSRALLLPLSKSSPERSPESRSTSHCFLNFAARIGSSISRELLACVQRPVLVQFWLPVQIHLGFFLPSQITRNLLFPRTRGETMRLCRSALPFNALRAGAFWSSPFFFTLPFASTT